MMVKGFVNLDFNYPGMHISLKWKKGLLSDTYRIYSGSIQIGHLKENFLKHRSSGELAGRRFNFITNGFFNHQTTIMNPEDETVYPKINYNFWKTNAVID